MTSPPGGRLFFHARDETGQFFQFGEASYEPEAEDSPLSRWKFANFPNFSAVRRGDLRSPWAVAFGRRPPLVGGPVPADDAQPTDGCGAYT